MQETIYKNLDGKNDENVLGEQIIVNESNEPIGINDRLLIGATRLNVDKIVKLIHDYEGIAIASHIDRESFSIIGQLGFIPGDIPLDAVELSLNYKLKQAEKYEDHKFPIVTFSDSHFIHDIGRNHTTFLLTNPEFDEIQMALQCLDNRKVYH